jgi:hypothetical protein
VLRTPPAEAIAEMLSAEGVAPDRALTAARAAQGHIGRARRLATDADAAARRDDVLAVPPRLTGLGPALSAAAALVKSAQAEASSAESSVRRIQAVMTCRERLELNVAPLLAVEEMTLALAAGSPRA